jgi:hypothetical protein
MSDLVGDGHSLLRCRYTPYRAVPDPKCVDRRCGGDRRGRMRTMTRWRAVPTTVWTAVAALAFLASCGLAVVLGAGLHVWSGPLRPADARTAGAARPGGTGVVTVAPPVAAQLPRTSGPGTGPPALPPPVFAPFTPASGPAPVLRPVVAPTEPTVALPRPPVGGRPFTDRPGLFRFRDGERAEESGVRGGHLRAEGRHGHARRSGHGAHPPGHSAVHLSEGRRHRAASHGHHHVARHGIEQAAGRGRASHHRAFHGHGHARGVGHGHGVRGHGRHSRH